MKNPIVINVPGGLYMCIRVSLDTVGNVHLNGTLHMYDMTLRCYRPQRKKHSYQIEQEHFKFINDMANIIRIGDFVHIKSTEKAVRQHYEDIELIAVVQATYRDNKQPSIGINGYDGTPEGIRSGKILRPVKWIKETEQRIRQTESTLFSSDPPKGRTEPHMLRKGVGKIAFGNPLLKITKTRLEG